jgi:hypothetical protein
MKNDQPPGDPGESWNSNEILFGKLTGDQLSRLLTVYISLMRTVGREHSKSGGRGVMSIIKGTFAAQEKIGDMLNATPETAKLTAEVDDLVVMATCLAGLSACSKIDPRYLAALGASSIEAVEQLATKVGPPGEDESIRIAVAKSPGEDGSEAIKMMVTIIPNSPQDPSKPVNPEQPGTSPFSKKPWEPGRN